MKTPVEPYVTHAQGNAAETLEYLRDGIAHPFDDDDRAFCEEMARDVAAHIIANGD